MSASCEMAAATSLMQLNYSSTDSSCAHLHHACRCVLLQLTSRMCPAHALRAYNVLKRCCCLPACCMSCCAGPHPDRACAVRATRGHAAQCCSRNTGCPRLHGQVYICNAASHRHAACCAAPFLSRGGAHPHPQTHLQACTLFFTGMSGTSQKRVCISIKLPITFAGVLAWQPHSAHAACWCRSAWLGTHRSSLSRQTAGDCGLCVCGANRKTGGTTQSNSRCSTRSRAELLTLPAECLACSRLQATLPAVCFVWLRQFHTVTRMRN